MDNAVCIYECSYEEALVIAGLLQASEIEVHLLEDKSVKLRPFSEKKPSTKILVSRETADFAYQIIKDASQNKEFSDFEQSAELE